MLSSSFFLSADLLSQFCRFAFIVLSPILLVSAQLTVGNDFQKQKKACYFGILSISDFACPKTANI